jgi:hypothetical protein
MPAVAAAYVGKRTLDRKRIISRSIAYRAKIPML